MSVFILVEFIDVSVYAYSYVDSDQYMYMQYMDCVNEGSNSGDSH